MPLGSYPLYQAIGFSKIMITIAVSARRTFTMPADLATTSAYFNDFERAIQDLQHLSLVKTYARNQYRIVYTAVEAGIYRVAFYCDVQVQFDEGKQALRVLPLAGISPVMPKVTINSMIGQGVYTSRSIFQSAGSNTNVNYEVEIRAEVPKRMEMKLVPDRVFKKMVENLVEQRMLAITDAYILHSIERIHQ
jgi:hypothetical protein